MFIIRDNPLYLITGPHAARRSHAQISRIALKAGVRTIQLREKEMPRRDIYREALTIRKITRQYNAVFIVNDYIDIALAVDADGVHIGQEDMPLEEARKLMGRRKIIGVSTHNPGQARKAEEGGADYIGFGPVFHTTTKDAGRPKGTEALSGIVRRIGIPVVAIGGITWENIGMVMDAGADAAAVSSGILAGDIRDNINKYLTAVGL